MPSKLTQKEAEEIIQKHALEGAAWTSKLESMGRGTPFHREWETISANGTPLLEIRRGTHDAGVYLIRGAV